MFNDVSGEMHEQKTYSVESVNVERCSTPDTGECRHRFGRLLTGHSSVSAIIEWQLNKPMAVAAPFHIVL